MARVDGMKIVDDIRPLSAEVYGRALDRFVSSIADTPGIRAVLQFGQISAPGISDLDLLVVVDDDVPTSTLRQIVKATRVDATAAYLFAHPPMVVPRSCVGGVAYIHTLYHLRPLWGQAIDLDAPSQNERHYLKVAEYTDFTFNVRSVLRSLSPEGVGLRSLLLLLTSCAHSLRLAGEITHQRLHGDIADRVEDLRFRVFEDREEGTHAARALVREAMGVLRQADRCMEDHLHSTGAISDAPSQAVVSHTDGRFYLFESPFRPVAHPAARASLSRTMVGRLARLDMSVDRFPGFYLAQFAAYSLGQGTYAQAHETFFGRSAADRITAGEYRSVLTTRVEIAQRIYDAVSRGGLLPMVPLGIGFRDPRRLRPSRRRQWLQTLAVSGRARRET